MHPEYFIFVPAYNVSQTLADVLGRIPPAIMERAQVLVIDDGSKDDTRGVYETFVTGEACVAGSDCAGDNRGASRLTCAAHLQYMRFEFNGDDDLWIYLDNVLVLDMGGVHDAFRGKINFRTGDVTCNALNGENTTIKAMFKKAGRFPDGTEWDDARVNEYFRGNTFKDFTTHNFKMFYMERGRYSQSLSSVSRKNCRRQMTVK